MAQVRKITAHIPEELLRCAQGATGDGITATVRLGLEVLAAGDAYEPLLGMRGKFKLGREVDLDAWREGRTRSWPTPARSSLA
ncbi:MAG: hypothetical protein R3F39_13505 [Myxococcota bacterium]